MHNRSSKLKQIKIEHLFHMVQVGEIGTKYTIPTHGTIINKGIIYNNYTTTVEGGYLMATTQTTYELWYTVRIWAEANGFHFQNFGLPGSHDSKGNLWWDNRPCKPPAITDQTKHQPVTNVSWRDVIVWTNALSIKTGLNPVYRSARGDIINDSRTVEGCLNEIECWQSCKNHIVDSALQTSHNGYRLPTSDEWEMAARWKHDTTSKDGSILVNGRFWTPGNYASGATADYNNEAATREVAWFKGASGGDFTRPVGQLLPNHLGIYDMSGNVEELTYTSDIFGDVYRIIRGGSYNYEQISDVTFLSSNRRLHNFADSMQVGRLFIISHHNADGDIGFRLVRGQ